LDNNRLTNIHDNFLKSRSIDYKSRMRRKKVEKSLLERRYKRIYEQLRGLFTKTNDKIARMATIVAVLHHKMPHFFWTGFYRIVDGELIVGPYQGPLACQVLEKNKGVCWACVNRKETIIVPDVEKFPGHIACDPRSKSEITVP